MTLSNTAPQPSSGSSQESLVAYPSRALISRSAFEHNLSRVRHFAPDSELMAVVKADAYGHGGVQIAQWACEAGVRWLMIAQLAEALTVREALDADCHILALLYEPGAPLRDALEASLDLNVGAEWMLEEVILASRARGRRARIHVEIDTGMARGGFLLSQLESWLPTLRAAVDAGDVELVGVWSHLASADDLSSEVTDQQLEDFTTALELVRRAGLEPEHVHLAASSGIVWHPRTHFTMVRPGVILYGLSPNPDTATAEDLGLRPVMTLQAPVVNVRDVPAGTPVSYGHTARTAQSTRLATVPLGYADGVPRAASNTAEVWIGGERQSIIGRVCMDQFVVPSGEVQPGDAVILFGEALESSGEGEARTAGVSESGGLASVPSVPSADEWAQKCETIGYEIVTQVGARVPRQYVD